jgi:DNA repair protein RadC
LLREEKIDRDKEHFWTVGLNHKNTILYVELISMGGTAQTIVEPMQVFRVGILKGVVKMLLVHNHPSGELKPSEADKDVTDRLIQVGNIIQIEMLDHHIISEKSYLSFEDTGLLDQIKKSTKYVPAYELEAKLRKQVESIKEEGIKLGKEIGEKIGEEKGILKQKKEMALMMKKQGEPVERIMLYTGLTEGEIKRLKE